jgi:hypothetical protein
MKAATIAEKCPLPAYYRVCCLHNPMKNQRNYSRKICGGILRVFYLITGNME